MSEEKKILVTPTHHIASDTMSVSNPQLPSPGELKKSDSIITSEDKNEINNSIPDINAINSHIEDMNHVSIDEKATDVPEMEKSAKKLTNWQEILDNSDKNTVLEYLKKLSKNELIEILTQTEKNNAYLLKEHDAYEFVLNEDETIRNSLDSIEVDDDLLAQEFLILSYPVKCYFARKKLQKVEKDLELKRNTYTAEIQKLKFELESLNMTLEDLKESKEKFNREIRIGGRHPVTRKVLLQKVANFFEESIRTKMALSNRYKVQIQSDIREHNKILSQIKAQEKRLASLDITEFQETQFEHKKSCKQLVMYKELLGKFKLRSGPLLQNLTQMKKALKKEENEMQRMKEAVAKREHLKEVIMAEKARNDQKVLELERAMRKIKLDPRRHNLPEVIDYAVVKRENVAIKKSIKKWEKKVNIVQEQKLLKLNSASKKD